MKKTLPIAGSVLLLLVAMVGGPFWHFASQPLYKSGMVRAGRNLRAPLAPPEQLKDDYRWKVEADIELHHFSAGQGRDVLVVHGGPGYPYTEPWPGLEPVAWASARSWRTSRGSGASWARRS